MNIEVDNRQKEIIYVDKVNLHNASNNDIIKLIAKDYKNKLEIYTNIIAGIYKLKEAERNLLNIIMKLGGYVYSPEAREKAKEIYSISCTNYFRTLYSLRDKKLIYIDVNNNVSVCSNIKLKNKDINNAKFIVIEIKDKNNNQCSI